MKTLFTMLAFAFLSFTAHAGQEYDKFIQDINLLSAAQKANQSILFGYVHINGALLKTVLDPERYGRVLNDSSGVDFDSLVHKNTMDKFNQTLNYFLKEFKSNNLPKYEEEYLDSLEISYRLAVFAVKLLNETPKDNTNAEAVRVFIDSTSKAANAVPNLIIYSLQKDITDEKFSSIFKPIAKKRLEKLSELSSKTKFN